MKNIRKLFESQRGGIGTNLVIISLIFIFVLLSLYSYLYNSLIDSENEIKDIENKYTEEVEQINEVYLDEFKKSY